MEAARHYLLGEYDYTEKTIEAEYTLTQPTYTLRCENGQYVATISWLVCLKNEYRFYADDCDLVYNETKPGKDFLPYENYPNVWIYSY